jgi:transposase
MLTPEEDMEIAALKKRGWSISAIAGHTGRDRKTVRAHLNGERYAGVRRRPDGEDDPFDRFEAYVRQRLTEDPHVWATVLFDEVRELGYQRSYPTFTRQVRDRELRPHCEPCASSNGRAHVDIEHPPGEEVQWDWLELDDTPWGDKAYVLVGSLSHSSKTRAWLSESDDQAHLIVGIHEVLERLGGTARVWRVDRMATGIKVGTNEVQRSFVPVAKHYGVTVVPCPPRHGNRKGVVEKKIDFITRRWWRTARVASMAEAQASLDRFCVEVADQRRRGDTTVGAADDAEPLLGLPTAAYPADVTVVRTVAANALVSLWGNRYSVPPGLASGPGSRSATPTPGWCGHTSAESRPAVPATGPGTSSSARLPFGPATPSGLRRRVAVWCCICRVAHRATIASGTDARVANCWVHCSTATPRRGRWWSVCPAAGCRSPPRLLRRSARRWT